MKLASERMRVLTKSEHGFSLIETAIALAVMGVVVVALLSAFATSSKTLYLADERETAKNLTEIQMEYVMQQSFSAAGTYSKMDTSAVPEYGSFLVANPAALLVSPTSDNVQMQKITINVSRNGRQYILEDYKVSR